MRLQRHAWHTRITLVFDQLSLLQSHRGETADAIETATRWLAHEPLNETVYQRLMQLYLAMGNRDGALRTYESCREILSGELRAKPAPETEALHERTRMTAGLFTSSSLPRSAAHKADTVSPTSMLVEGPLVGRTKEIENYWGQVNCNCQLAMGSLEAGAFSEALAYAQQAVTFSRTQGVSILLNASLTILGRILRAILDLDAALAAHLEIIEATKVLFAQTIEMTAAELCVDYALSEKWDVAHTYAVQALENRLNSPFLYMGLTRWYETEALLRAGEIERAIDDVQHFETHFGKSKRYRIPHLRSLAVLAHYRGEIGAAIIHLCEAAKLAEEIGLPGELWLIRVAQGDLYLKQGENEQARKVYREAARLVHELTANISEDERRTTYLSSPLVQRILHAATL